MSTGLQRQGSQFLYNGKPVFISSIDCETLATDTRFDLDGMLDLFVRHGFNKIRLWARSWHGIWTGPPDVFLRPWKAIPGPNGWSDTRFDLDQWDDAYWARLRQFCAAALKRDFIVEVSLFAEWIRNFGPFHVRGILCSYWWEDEMARPEWNSKFNVNGVFTTNAENDFWPEFCNLDHSERSRSGKTLRDYQQAYIDKALQELDEFPNVYYELFNEFLPFPQAKDGPAPIDQGAAWQNHWAAYLKEHSKRLVGVCAHQIGEYQGQAIGVRNFQDKPFIDVLNFHWFGEDPLKIARVAQPLHRHGKVLANNEGEWHGVTGPALEPEPWANRITRSVWGMFLAGSHYSYTEFPPEAGNPRWVATAQRFKVLREIAESLTFSELQPVDAHGELFDSLIRQGPGKHWRLIARPGHEYLAYFWFEDANHDLLIDLSPGSYAATWYDPRNGQNLFSLEAKSTAPGLTLPAPPATSWHPDAGLALVLRRTNS